MPKHYKEMIDEIINKMDEDAPANAVAHGGVDMAPNAGKKKKKEEVPPKLMDVIMKRMSGKIKEDNDNNNVVIDELLGSSYINFSDNIVGIYIPADEVLRRTKYEWFARLSNDQLLESDIIVAKHILLSNKQ